MDATQSPALLSPPAPASRASGSAEAAAAADFNKFLTLLTAQLRNQDPMQPIESTEFVAQLASFSTVEQLVGTNDRLDGLQASAAASEVAALAGWIGRQVATTDGAFRSTGTEVRFSGPALSGSEQITARVIGKDGAELRRIEITPDANGRGEGLWDGRDDRGLAVTGEARIELSYKKGDTVLQTAPATVFRSVVAVRATAEGARLELEDGLSVVPWTVAQLQGGVSKADEVAS